MLRDNPVGLIRADGAAREVSISLALLSFIPPSTTAQERNIGRKDPSCRKMPDRLPAGRGNQLYPRKFTAPAG